MNYGLFNFLIAIALLLLTNQTAWSYTLQGSVEASEERSLQSVRQWEKKFLKSVKVGRVLDQSLLPKTQECLIWIRIPTTFAGTWQSQLIEHYAYMDGVEQFPKRAAIKYVRHYGMQMDRAGNIWHVIGCPEIQRTESDNTQTISVVYPEEISPGIIYKAENNSLTRLISGAGTTVSLPSMTVMSVGKSHNKVTIEATATGTLLNTDVMLGGNGSVLEMNKCLFAKVAPFKAIEREYGIDLREDLKRYLKNHDLEDLIPN